MTDSIGTAQERELIETLRSLLSEATARPWIAFDEGNVLALMKGHRPREYSTAKGRRWQEIIAWTGFDAADVPKHYRRANLHLIVAAINGLPAILDALQSRIAEVGRLTETSIANVWRQAEENHRTYSAMGDHESEIRFLTLGLAGEAGEVANFVKKRWRDGDDHDKAIKLEIADVCAYAFMLASTMGMTPADLIQTLAHKQQVFIDKMKARDARKTA